MLRREYFAELRQDLRFGLRQLWKNPAFACVAMLTLALGIGGTAAIFSVVNAVVLRPLPVREPDRLAYLFETGRTFQRGGVSAGNFTEWSRRNDVFVGLAGDAVEQLQRHRGRRRRSGSSARASPGRYFDVARRSRRARAGLRRGASSSRDETTWSCSAIGSGRACSVAIRASSAAKCA